MIDDCEAGSQLNTENVGNADNSVAAHDSEIWPPSFPHAEIDALLEKLIKGTEADNTDAEELLRLIGREAQRLRTAVVRLSSARLSAAEVEAYEIRTDAEKQAHDVRQRALAELNSRILEAEDLAAATQRSRPTERRKLGSGQWASDDSASDSAAQEDHDR